MIENGRFDSKEPQAYDMALKVGVVGSIILGFATMLGNTLAGLTALAVWCLVIPFVLPWLFLCYYSKGMYVPYCTLKGPHQ